jgi:transcriptional regulator with XRE-family HTH domain
MHICYSRPVSDNEIQEDADRRVGANLRRLREAANVTQVELAKVMTNLGWQWHQSTVARVEAGQQAVRFAEAEAVVQVLGGTLDRLTWAQPETEAVYSITRNSLNLRRSASETTRRLHYHLNLLDSARQTLAEHQGSRDRGVLDASRQLETDIREWSLEAVLDEARNRHEAGKGLEEAN